MDDETSRIGRKPFTALRLSLAGLTGGLVIVAVYAAQGEMTAPAAGAFVAAGVFIVAVCVFLDKTWVRVRSFVILGTTTTRTPSTADETKRIRADKARFDYRAAAVRSTVFPLVGAGLVGFLTGQLVALLWFGIGFAAAANILVLVLALVLRRRRGPV